MANEWPPVYSGQATASPIFTGAGGNWWDVDATWENRRRVHKPGTVGGSVFFDGGYAGAAPNGLRWNMFNGITENYEPAESHMVDPGDSLHLEAIPMGTFDLHFTAEDAQVYLAPATEDDFQYLLYEVGEDDPVRELVEVPEYRVEVDGDLISVDDYFGRRAGGWFGPPYVNLLSFNSATSLARDIYRDSLAVSWPPPSPPSGRSDGLVPLPSGWEWEANFFIDPTEYMGVGTATDPDLFAMPGDVNWQVPAGWDVTRFASSSFTVGQLGWHVPLPPWPCTVLWSYTVRGITMRGFHSWNVGTQSWSTRRHPKGGRTRSGLSAAGGRLRRRR